MSSIIVWISRVFALTGALLTLGMLPTPAAASSVAILAHFTCAGVAGTMADGHRTHVGAAGLFPGALRTYPYGTVLQDDQGQMLTVEDTGPNWSPFRNGRLRIDLYNYFSSSDCYRNFRVHDGWVTVKRYGWHGEWRD